LAVERHGQAVRIVGAAVVQEFVPDPENAAVTGQSNFGVMDLRTLMSGGEEMLGAILDPFVIART